MKLTIVESVSTVEDNNKQIAKRIMSWADEIKGSAQLILDKPTDTEVLGSEYDYIFKHASEINKYLEELRWE